MIFLVDTNVVSELGRVRPDPGVVAWVRRQERLHVCAVTVEEIVFGITAKPHPRLMSWWRDFLATAVDVHPVDEDVARRAGELRGSFRAVGVQRALPDMLIAATAARLGATVVTRNVRDFAGCGVAVLDPFGSVPRER